MNVERTYRDTWAIPQRCCFCGEPAVDGAPFTPSFTLKRDVRRVAYNEQVITTTTAKLSFPRCAACERAKKEKSRYESIAMGITVLPGLLGCGLVANADGSPLAWGIYIAVMIGIAWVAWVLMKRRWTGSVDADSLRRAALPDFPVLIKRSGGPDVLPMLTLTFLNEDYGQAFSAMNP
jgi:hypothetical protein